MMDLNDNNNDDAPPRTVEEKRRLFDEERRREATTKFLAEIPNEAKDRFGKIYFTKWGKQVMPVLVMNPYSIPPGAARKLWVDMFDNLKNSGRLANMTNLVYWYGSSRDTDNRYSVWVTKNLIPYEAGIKMKLDQIPPALQKKIDQGKKPSGVEAQFVDALTEMKEDLAREPHERRGYLPQYFCEVLDLSTDDKGNETPKRKNDTEGMGRASPRQKKKKKQRKKERLNLQTVVSESFLSTGMEKGNGIAEKPPDDTRDEISV